MRKPYQVMGLLFHALNSQSLRSLRADAVARLGELNPVIFPIARDAREQIRKARHALGPA